MRGRVECGIIRAETGAIMGLVKTRRLAAMQKQQRAKAAFKPPKPPLPERGSMGWKVCDKGIGKKTKR